MRLKNKIKTIDVQIKYLSTRLNRIEDKIWLMENPQLFEYGDEVAIKNAKGQPFHVGRVVGNDVLKTENGKPYERRVYVDTGKSLVYYDQDSLIKEEKK